MQLTNNIKDLDYRTRLVAIDINTTLSSERLVEILGTMSWYGYTHAIFIRRQDYECELTDKWGGHVPWVDDNFDVDSVIENKAEEMQKYRDNYKVISKYGTCTLRS